jgi:hypothetical protein
MKGKKNVLGEVNLMFMIYNLRTSLSILGLKELKKRLKALIDSGFCKTRLYEWILQLLRPFSHLSYRLAILQ